MKVIYNNKGFTLIELIVVLIIIAVSSALVAPRFLSSFSNINLRTAVKKISASLRYARNIAISQKKNIKVVFDLENKKVFISSETTRIFSDIDEMQKNDPEFRFYSLPDGVSIKNTNEINFFEVIFFPKGSNTGGEIMLENEHGKTITIKINYILGTIKIHD
ncbi:MAG: GspH/FimT family protein [Desulfobacterales bacterium]|nr:GspH/FimT family protein [Desulfobacterales bacterium]